MMPENDSRPSASALQEAKTWLCEWERGAETKPADVEWFARALDAFALAERLRTIEECARLAWVVLVYRDATATAGKPKELLAVFSEDLAARAFVSAEMDKDRNRGRHCGYTTDRWRVRYG